MCDYLHKLTLEEMAWLEDFDAAHLEINPKDALTDALYLEDLLEEEELEE
jgi:hypothetical protein